MENFTFIGKILKPSPNADPEKVYNEKTFDSGWVSRTCNFQMQINDQYLYLQAKGGKFTDDSKSKVYTFVNGKDGKHKNKEIPFTKRLDKKLLSQVPDWAKYTVDLSTGDKQKKSEYVSPWDFAEVVYKLVRSGKYDDVLFKVTGNVNRSYSPDKDRWYVSYEPKKIVRMNGENVKQYAHSTVELFFDRESLPEVVVDDDMATADCFVKYWNSQDKAEAFAPYTLTIRRETNAENQDLADRKFDVVQRKFFKVDDEKVYKLSAIVEVFNGSHKVELDYDQLDEEVRLNIELGLITEEDAIRDMSEDGNVYGERVQENIFIKPGRGYTKGRMVDEDLKPEDLRNIAADDVVLDDEDSDLDYDDEDIFAEDDGLDLDSDDLPF